jgi:HEAT repeat protein
MKLHSMLKLALAALLVLGCAGPSTVRTSSADAANLTGVVQTLIDLLGKQDTTKFTADDYESTSLKDINSFATPAGMRIRLRYQHFGVALVEALKIARDSELRRRMIEMVQWSRDPAVRAEAIITLATLLDPAHKKYFKEAILDSKVGIRFAAVEALQIWSQPDSIVLLKTAMVRDLSPLMQIYSAQALLSLGDESGLPILWQGLDNQSWVIRAMSARYLGDYAQPEEYTKIMSYLNRENHNNFVEAEMALSVLKLISKKGDKISYSPATAGWKDNEEVAYTVGKDKAIELEPLVIVPPQLRIPASLQVAAQVNIRLLRLLKDKLNEPLDPIQAQDPEVQELGAMVTPTGFALNTRYAELSYLVIEALAGTQDEIMRTQLRTMAQSDPNGLIRASAMIALAYNRDPDDSFLMEDALTNAKEARTRMGALEAIEIGRFRNSVPAVFTTAGTDPSPALQISGLQVLARFDNPSGRQSMLGRLNDPDWPARAMAFWYLGRYGTSDDYSMILARMPVETNPFVQSEIVLAALRLAPVE